MRDTEGAQSKFVQSWDAEAAYMLDPGQYTLLLHMDAPDTEKTFSLVLKSSAPVDVRSVLLLLLLLVHVGNLNTLKISATLVASANCTVGQILPTGELLHYMNLSEIEFCF